MKENYTLEEVKRLMRFSFVSGFNHEEKDIPKEFYDSCYVHPYYGSLAHMEWNAEKQFEFIDETFKNEELLNNILK